MRLMLGPPMWAKYVVLSQTVDTDSYFYYRPGEYDDAVTKAKRLWTGGALMYNIVFDIGEGEIVFQRGLPLNRQHDPDE